MAKTATFIRTERDMADFLDNGVIGLHWVAADGTILWANRADYEPLGYTREEYVGHHIAEFHADPAVLDDILQRLSEGETLYNYRARLRHKNGSFQNVLIASSVLFDGEGNFVHTRCFTVLAPANA
jgi:PAS domain S-box-containing protein